MSAKKRRFRNPKAKAPEERNWSEEIARGYTSNPALSLAGEPECIDWGDLNIRWTMRAGKRYEIALIERDELRRRARELLTVEERMRVAREAARFNHVDVRDELKALRHMQRRGRNDVTVIRELERVERIAHRDAA